MGLNKKILRVTMPDGSKWDYSVEAIALNRATYYAKEFGEDVQKSLDEDTIPLFNSDDYEIEDWAINNMNYDTISYSIETRGTIDYQEGWLNGEKEVL